MLHVALTFGQSPRSAAAPRPSLRSRPSFGAQSRCTLSYRSDCGVVPQVESKSDGRGEEHHTINNRMITLLDGVMH